MQGGGKGCIAQIGRMRITANEGLKTSIEKRELKDIIIELRQEEIDNLQAQLAKISRQLSEII